MICFVKVQRLETHRRPPLFDLTELSEADLLALQWIVLFRLTVSF